MNDTKIGTRHIVSLQSLFGFLIVLAVLLPLYLSTLQTIPNGSEHYFMIDVGETQIVLNTWGTLHATGYPLYVMSGNVLVSFMRALGLSSATAPALVSLLWGVLALAIVFGLQLSVLSSQNSKTENSELRTRNFTYPYLLAAVVTSLFGLTRTVWIHNTIAEIYSFGLLILALLLAIGLWPRPVRGRIYWLAFIGGNGVFHHRALLMVAPALLHAVWREIVFSRQSSVNSSQLPVASSQLPVPRTRNSELGTDLVLSSQSLKRIGLRLLLCVLLGLIGFLPYAYLPLRANAGAEWVYGQPNTWPGFWDQFFGREAERFIGAPGSWDALLANINAVNTVLLTDLTAPGLVAGLAGLLLALRKPNLRRAAMTFLISGATAYVFHILLYRDILSALILPATLSAAFGWLFLADAAIGDWRLVIGKLAVAGVMVILGVALIAQNQPFIAELTQNTTGMDTIALVEAAPPGSTLMLAWGPRYFAASFAQDVQGRLQDINLVDHRADYATILKRGQRLVTPDYTFYNQPVSWWEDKLGARVYLNAVAPHLVQIKTQPELAASPSQDVISVQSRQIECTSDDIHLRVAWLAGSKPERDLSVFVHLLDADGNIVAQDDQIAPVYGWRPLTTWEAGEIVSDVYILPRRDDAAMVRFGLYYQAVSGEFVNEVLYELPVDCG